MATSTTLIKNAKKYIGMPYVWGGESKEEGGFDCSGYMFNVMKDSGMKVNRSTAQGYSNLGIAVDYKNAIPGDLLFFGKSKTKITHIAMYAGNGLMYESVGGSKNTKSNPGKGVSLNKVERRKDLVLVKKISSDTPSVATPTIKYFPKYTGNTVSIVNALKTVNAETSFSYRTKIAKANNIKSYVGTAKQNRLMIELLKDGKLIKP